MTHPAGDIVRVFETDDSLRGLSADAFLFEHGLASLAIAFVSPHVDFSRVARDLRRLAGEIPLVAASTAGELCSATPEAALYKPASAAWSTVALQIFSPDLLRKASIQTIPLHNEDIRYGAAPLARADRIDLIVSELLKIQLPFRLDARDTVALTFIDGLSASENYLMEAIYRSTEFPCLFVGGSAGGKLDFRHTYLFDGRNILEDHAVIVFLKLSPGKRYGVLKSQNFIKTGHSFVVVDADPDHRTVSTFLDEVRGEVIPAIDALAGFFDVHPDRLPEKLSGHTFAIELDGELFVRSIAGLDAGSGKLTFYCDVNQGEELLLVEATDFVEQTRRDIAAFLRGKPQPLAAILNDCILRRINNEGALADLRGSWPAPAVGFSTFGELLGININQTLTALVFFDTAEGPIEDEFVDSFPVHYARFCSYFERRQLNRGGVMARLRSGIVRRLAAHLGAGSALTQEFEALLTQSADVRSTIESIHGTLAREVAREQEAHALKTRYELILGAAGDGIVGIDADGSITFANSAAGVMLGVPAAQLMGREYRSALCGPGDQDRFPPFPLAETGKKSREGFFLRAEGSTFIAEYDLTPILQFGCFQGAVLAFRDISLRKHYEAEIAHYQRDLEQQVEERTRELKKAEREAQQAAHLATIGQLAAGIAHEINTPVQYVTNNLAYIGQALSALREATRAETRLESLWQELPSAVSESLEGVDQITRIVNSMKEFSHPGTTSKSTVDVNKALESTLTVCRNVWKAVATVETDFDLDLPPISCFGGEMNQVYLNLIVNAAHAIETSGKPLPGMIRIITRRDGDFVTIEIVDNGTGIPEELRDRIFAPFFTTKEVGKGTGQGLAICRDVVVSKHGGTLEAGGRVGEGAVFTLRLPIA